MTPEAYNALCLELFDIALGFTGLVWFCWAVARVAYSLISVKS